MSDNQRRAFCRIIFICICILPTTVVGYWICHPQTTSSWELAIKAQLGVNASIDKVETPGPYVTILRNVEFSDPTFGRLFKASEVKVSFFENENVVEVPHKIQGLTNHGLTHLIDNVNEQLLRSHGAEKLWRIVFAKELIVEEARSAELWKNDPTQFPPHVTLANLEVHVRPAGEYVKGPGNYAKALFNVIGSNDENQFVEFEISQTQQYGHRVFVNTKTVKLPCWLVEPSLPMIPQSFGLHSTFAGEAGVTPSLLPTVEVVGTFENVALQPGYVEQSGNYPSVNLDCAFVNGNKIKWDVTYRPSQYSAAIPVAFEDMKESRTELNPKGAVISAILKSQGQTARLELSNRDRK